MEIENAKKLIIVCGDRELCKQAKQLFKTEDGKKELLVDLGEEKCNVIFWSESFWHEYKKTKFVYDKVLFLGDIKETNNILENATIFFDEFGVKCGCVENRAKICADFSQIQTKEKYDEFVEELCKLPSPEISKRKVNINISTGKAALTVASDIFLTFGISSLITATNIANNRKKAVRQMLIYGLIRFCSGYLFQFFNVETQKCVDERKKTIEERLAYAYIRNIKKWIVCPTCKHGKMIVNKSRTNWVCEDCGYTLSIKEYESGYTFWFCNECDEYLNVQQGFDKHLIKHKCTKCGCENITIIDNASGVCADCGKTIPNTDENICQECKLKRKENVKIGLFVAATTIGAICAACASCADEEIDNEDDDEDEEWFDDWD